MRITIDAALREQHGERDDDCEMDQRHEEERGLHRGAKLLPTGTKSGDTRLANALPVAQRCNSGS